mmetsp:Transcript_35548/g.92675  ORF Transcript_35548/g.92675 Transcript_35548/m.92675 type:complete len:90 (-) Transcript_35548:241-510(-)
MRGTCCSAGEQSSSCLQSNSHCIFSTSLLAQQVRLHDGYNKRARLQLPILSSSYRFFPSKLQGILKERVQEGIMKGWQRLDDAERLSPL